MPFGGETLIKLDQLVEFIFALDSQVIITHGRNYEKHSMYVEDFYYFNNYIALYTDCYKKYAELNWIYYVILLYSFFIAIRRVR